MTSYITVNSISESTPGFTFGRSGLCSQGTYLLCDQVPSNLAGRLIPFTNASISNIIVVCQSESTFDIVVQKRVSNIFTDIYTASIISSRTFVAEINNVEILAGDELCVKVGSGSASNIIVGLVIKSSGIA